MTLLPESNPDLTILQQIEQDPDATQATLAARLNVAVGTINWHLKRLVEKGYVKVRRVERRKLRYIITPEGLALRARMTMDYIDNSFQLYRLARQRSIAALEELEAAGWNRVQVIGNGDIAEVCRLTCMEKGFQVVDDSDSPRLVIQEFKIIVDMEAKS